jgi:hypothetical protein
MIGGRLSNRVISAVRRFCPDELLRLVPTMPGDVVIFDGRLLHTSVPGPKLAQMDGKGNGHYQTYVENIPVECRKYVFYWFAGEERLKQAIFMNNFQYRADRLDDSYYDGGGFNYKRAVQLSYPEDYPLEFSQRAVKLGVSVASRP